MTTRQVYWNTVRSRSQGTPLGRGLPSAVTRPTRIVVTTYEYLNPRDDYHSSNPVRQNMEVLRSSGNTSLQVRKPTSEQLREARLNKFQTKYDHDKEVFKVKEEERNRKKLEEKLKRYKGVGELGNKMTEDKLTEEQKYDQYWRSRDNYDTQYQNDSNLAQQEKIEREKEKELKDELERLSFQEDASTTLPTGGRLGGNTVNIAKGQHPLLDKLSTNLNM